MVKPTKTRDQLRAMILAEIKGHHPVCPAGMDVAVRQLKLSWGVDCIPPSAGRIAYADCCDLITKIAARLRNEFDLSPN
jgi:hypothetical protein